MTETRDCQDPAISRSAVAFFRLRIEEGDIGIDEASCRTERRTAPEQEDPDRESRAFARIGRYMPAAAARRSTVSSQPATEDRNHEGVEKSQG